MPGSGYSYVVCGSSWSGGVTVFGFDARGLIDNFASVARASFTHVPSVGSSVAGSAGVEDGATPPVPPESVPAPRSCDALSVVASAAFELVDVARDVVSHPRPAQTRGPKPKTT